MQRLTLPRRHPLRHSNGKQLQLCGSPSSRSCPLAVASRQLASAGRLRRLGDWRQAPCSMQQRGPQASGRRQQWPKLGLCRPPAAARPAEQSAPDTGQEGAVQPAAELTEADVDADVFKQLPPDVQRELRLSFMHAAASARLKAGKQPQLGTKAARPISGFFSQKPGQPTSKHKG